MLWYWLIAFFTAWEERAVLIKERNDALALAEQAKADREEMRDMFVHSYLTLYAMVKRGDWTVALDITSHSRVDVELQQFKRYYNLAYKWSRPRVPSPAEIWSRLH